MPVIFPSLRTMAARSSVSGGRLSGGAAGSPGAARWAGGTGVMIWPSVVLARRLQVAPGTLDYLAGRSIAAHVAETREAVKIYNDLADGAPVAGLFHSTC